MKNRIIILPEAERDLDQQATYLTDEGSIETALRFVDAVEATLFMIASHPGLGCSRRYRNPELAGIRMFPVTDFPKYLVFYRTVSCSIEVVRLLHGSRDIEKLFR